ncbi:carboxypeptidase regulatory-like domain-containing protein [Lysobacter sp. A378]
MNISSLDFTVVITGVLALAVVLASARSLWHRHRQPPSSRPRVWRTVVLLLAQVASAWLLYQVLCPPPVALTTGTLVVLTAGASEVTGQAPADARVIALPESHADTDTRPDAERFGDLASALRHYPATKRLRVVGAGLVARDRDAVRGYPVEFHPAPLPEGLLELHSPTQVPVGRQFAITGRAMALDGGSAELRDPAGGLVSRSAIEDKGRFELHARTRSAGVTSYRLQIRDADSQVVDDVVVPVQATPTHPLRVLMMAGAPNPELKFLRRWALDAGAELDTSISLGAGLQIGTTASDLRPAALDQLDLLVLDHRRWHGLGRRDRSALAAAADGGLGVLLRLDGPVNGADRNHLETLGFSASTTATPREIRLARSDLTEIGTDPATDTVATADNDTAASPTLHTRSPQLSAADAVTLLADASGAPVSIWRAHGRGRVGVSIVNDSYRLVLAGRDDVHGDLWSDAFTTLARPAPVGSPPTVDAAAPGQRSVICGIGEQASVLVPGGHSAPLTLDPASDGGHCAGFWADTSGWHQLRDADRTLPFYVREPSDAPGLAAYTLHEATRALAAPAIANADTPALTHESAARSTRLSPRLLWFCAWLLLVAASWWLERARRGQPAARPGST